MPKILIIEDEAALRKALVNKFTFEDFNVLQAVDGQEGLEMALKEKPDIILLDILMPKMDGMSMLEELRKDSWGKRAKVIMLTNLSDAQNVQKAVTKGVFDYLVKSDWEIEDLVKKVKDKLVKL